MPRFKVLLTDYAWPDLDIEREILADVDAELIVAPDTREETLVDLARDADAIMFNWAPVPASVIQAGARLQILSRLGIGLDNVDLAAATERGVVVTNVPDYCLSEVADHTIALLLALARKVAWFHHESKSGTYDLQSGPPMHRLAGQTLGIVGMGNIGRLVAARAGALELKRLAYDVRPAEVEGVRLTTLDDLLAQSDYVTLHVPLLPQTRHLIGSAQLAKMKPGAYLINTARGGLVDSQALAAALANNRLAGAALDVQEQEPPPLDQPPYSDPRVIVTPHAAFYSEESVRELRGRVARQVAARLVGRIPDHVANREVLD